MTTKYFAICEKPEGPEVELTVLPVKGNDYEEATLASSLPPNTEIAHWVLTREQLEKFIAEGQRALTTDYHKLIEFIQKVESDHFRTQEDTGANLNAMLVWNRIREFAGLSKLRVENLPNFCPECERYHVPGKHLNP